MTIEQHLEEIGAAVLRNSVAAEARGDDVELQNWHELTLMVNRAFASIREVDRVH